MIESIDRVVNAIGGFLYRPYIVPLFLLAASLGKNKCFLPLG